MFTQGVPLHVTILYSSSASGHFGLVHHNKFRHMGYYLANLVCQAYFIDKRRRKASHGCRFI